MRWYVIEASRQWQVHYHEVIRLWYRATARAACPSISTVTASTALIRQISISRAWNPYSSTWPSAVQPLQTAGRRTDITIRIFNADFWEESSTKRFEVCKKLGEWAGPGGRTVFGRFVTGIVASNPARGHECLFLCFYVVLFWVGRGICNGLITRPKES
jgi:hypothetical protein